MAALADAQTPWQGPALCADGQIFTDPAVETRYMKAMVPENSRRVAFVYGIAVIVSLVNLLADTKAHWHHPDTLAEVAMHRIGVILVGTTLAVAARRTRDPRMIRILAVFAALFLGGARTLNLLNGDPGVYGGPASIIGTTALLYIGLPILPPLQVPLMLALSASMCVAYLSCFRAASGEVIDLFLWLGIMHFMGIRAVRAMRRTLRRSYAQGVVLEHLAMHDALTGLANRRGFETALAAAWEIACRERRPVSVVSIDVDHFKLYNDTMGHAAGDEVLKALAEVFAASAWRAGDLMARTGGEEFCCLLPHTDANGAQVIAERIRAKVEAARIAHPKGAAGIVTVSLGVASVSAPQMQGRDALLRDADRRLYAAKSAGRNRVVA